MLVAMRFGAAAFGERFGLYLIATMVILVSFGALTGLDGPPGGGKPADAVDRVWERISIGAFLLWVVVLAMRPR